MLNNNLTNLHSLYITQTYAHYNCTQTNEFQKYFFMQQHFTFTIIHVHAYIDSYRIIFHSYVNLYHYMYSHIASNCILCSVFDYVYRISAIIVHFGLLTGLTFVYVYVFLKTIDKIGILRLLNTVTSLRVDFWSLDFYTNK